MGIRPWTPSIFVRTFVLKCLSWAHQVITVDYKDDGSCVASVNHLGMLLAGNTDTNMAANKVVTDNRWMTISEQYDNLSIQLTPLLAERLDVMQATAGMALLVGLPSSTELVQHPGAKTIMYLKRYI